MLTSKQKLYTILDVINDKRVLLPNDAQLYLDPKHDLKGYFPEEELASLLHKLQDDEKVLKVVQWPPLPEYQDKEKDAFYGIVVKSDPYQKFTSKIQEEPEYKNFKITPSPSKSVINDSSIALNISYTDANEILINDLFLLSRPDYDSENEVVFEFLYHHPNKKHTVAEMTDALGRTIGKSPHKIVENLGFTGNIKRIFMQVTKDAICFKNPITKTDLEKLGITKLKLQH